MLIIHNSGGVLNAISSGGLAEIQEEEIDFTTEEENPCKFKSKHLDFEAGLYLVERSGYPITEDEKTQIIKKARSRVGENDYKFSSNNCEFFVTWAITGYGTCEQLQNAGPRLLADVADSTVCNYRSATVKTVFDKGVQSTIIGIEKAVLKGSSNLMVKTAATATTRVATGAVAAIAVVPIEAISCALSIKSLIKKLKEEKIDDRTFKRETTKKISGSAAAAAAGVGGAVIGQIIIPVPIVGGIVGGLVGGLIGRLSGTVVSGKVYDIVE